MSLTTLLDIAKANGSDPVVGLIDEARRAVPEVDRIAARTIKGINYKTHVRTANPTAAFRSANNGADYTKGTYEERLVECFIMDVPWACDKAVADVYEDGPEAYIALEASGIVNAAMQRVAAQMWYGGDASGFPQITATSGMTIDAGGTTAATGSSVWAVQFGPQGVQFVVGRDGSFDMDDVIVETIDGANSKPMKAYTQNLLFRIGLQVGNLNGVARLKDITADSGKSLDDDKLADLMALFPVGYRPDALFMSRRSLTQLKKSRTATTPTGAPASTPTDYEGVPIIVTDSLLDTETLS
jgi:hypothetical protein